MLAVSVVLKCAWSFSSAGTCDASLFWGFARLMQSHGIEHLYREVPLFNHMPLTAWSLQWLYRVTNGDYASFAAFLRLACVAADAAVGVAVIRVAPRSGLPAWAVGLFVLSPVSLMISGFHGNVDPIMTAFLFFAAVAAWQQRPSLCGLLFALACNIKIAPLVVGPVFFFFWLGRSPREAVRFTAAFALAMFAGAAWPLLTCPAEFARQVAGYGSYWGTWGVTFWLKQSGLSAFAKVGYAGLTTAQGTVMTSLKLIIVGSALAIAWLRRRAAANGVFTTLAAVFLPVFAFAPGVGVQYLVWCAPFILMASPRWYAAITLCSAVFIAAFYSACSADPFPWIVIFPKGDEIRLWGPWSNLPWLAFLAMLAIWLPRQLRPKKREAGLPALPPSVDAAAIAAPIS